MRTPQKLRSSTGETYFRVRYRRQGKQRSVSFWGPTAEKDATEFVGLLDTIGADRAVAWWNANLDRPEVGMTVDEWWGRYLKSLTGITEGTRVTYQRTYARVWQGAIGGLPLTSVGREDIAQVVNELAVTKADKTVHNAYGVIAQAFKVAVRDGHIPTTPCKDIRLPRNTEHRDTEMRFLTHDEWADLYDCLPAHYRPLFTLLVGTGIRWGEAEALTVSDVVLEPTPVVRVTKAAKWNAGKATRDVGPTKTKRSKRTVTLPPEVVDEILPLLARPGPARLFVAAKGGELRHSKVYPAWLAACEKAGVGAWVHERGKSRRWDGPRIHDLRHTQVAWLIAAGVPLPVIQARLGHESIKTTIDRYGHLLPDLQAAAAEAASVAMRGVSRRPAIAAGDTPALMGAST